MVADRARLAEALSLFLADSAGESSGATSLRISTARSGSSAVIRIAPVSASARARASTPADARPGEADGASGESSPLILASRLISAQGGEVGLDDGALMLRVG